MLGRRGATLVEVLVAIFVTSLGLIALIALFPVGTLSMARAIQNSRASQAAANASAVAQIKAVRTDPSVVGPPSLFTAPGTAWPTPDTAGPSYPVYVDPIGSNIAPGSAGSPSVLGSIAGTSPGIPRVTPSCVSTASAAALNHDTALWLSLGDDMTFLPTGGAATYTVSGTPYLDRERKYSWCYLLQLATSSIPPTTVAPNMLVVVYSGRSPVTLAETSYQVDFAANTNTVIVNYGAAGLPRPAIRPGQWVLDATVIKSVKPLLADPHGDFYRVVNITDIAAGSVLLEFEKNIKHGSATGFGVLCVMDNVVEVFDRGTRN